MAKDFAKSYEQRAWENASYFHTFWKKYLQNHSNSEIVKKHANARIQELEKQYPQLKK